MHYDSRCLRGYIGIILVYQCYIINYTTVQITPVGSTEQSGGGGDMHYQISAGGCLKINLSAGAFNTNQIGDLTLLSQVTGKTLISCSCRVASWHISI